MLDLACLSCTRGGGDIDIGGTATGDGAYATGDIDSIGDMNCTLLRNGGIGITTNTDLTGYYTREAARSFSGLSISIPHDNADHAASTLPSSIPAPSQLQSSESAT